MRGDDRSRHGDNAPSSRARLLDGAREMSGLRACRLLRAADGREGLDMTGLQRRILEIVANETDSTLDEIATSLGCSRDDLLEPMRDLVQLGAVKMKEDYVLHDWIYRLT